ncbi:autotransporter assembly complex protein TamA [Bartonella raoultii]|uniref:Autotransporter assembly complex protein TamA n=1 Tax=Bartonella raoultii TaxID=1457020 RepID=A0ABS7I4W0_9HYPH|nr:autotransporter assembly complex family protein [Bartonella raoultii]MBX4335312.1 autotransporter assembly complex protein TamA [Bartonella raoultii]
MVHQARVLLKSGTIFSVIIGVCSVFSFPQSLAAFEIFGIPFGQKKTNTSSHKGGREKFYKVDVVTPRGAPSEGIKIVKSASSLVADQDKALSSSSGLLAKARSDYRAILSALYADGRYGSVISIKINGLEVADLSPVTQLPAQSHIVITIDAGPQYVFNIADINKVAPSVKSKTHRMPTIEELGYKVGDVAKSETILKAEKWALEGWRRQGYAKAKIMKSEMIADHARRIVDGNIIVDLGQKAYYGPVNVRNISKKPHVDSAYIAWMTGLQPGQKYNPDSLAKASERLARLNVFRAINIREDDKIKPDGSLPLTFIVEERKPRRFGIGGSYSTLDGAGFETYWMHNNLFGHAEHLKIEAKISDIGSRKKQSYNFKNFNYLLGSTFIKPGIFTPDTDFRAELKMQQDVLDNYTIKAIRGKLGVTHIFNNNLSGQVSVEVSNGYSHDIYFGNRKFTTIGFPSHLIYDSRDNKFNATKGLYGKAVIEPFYEMRFNNFVEKMTVEGSSYWALDEKNRFIFAARAKLGAILGSEAAQVPSDMLFFAGGGGSVRGYAYRNIGIKTENNTVVGGRSLVEGAAELRFALNDKIGVVGFIDGGVVGKKVRFDFSQKVKWGAGIGGRYMTGLGPLRVDLAFPLKRQKGDPRIGFYVGIGQAF